MTSVSNSAFHSQAFWSPRSGNAAGADHGAFLDKMATRFEELERRDSAAARAVEVSQNQAPVNAGFIAQQLAQQAAPADEAAASVSAQEDEEETSAAVRTFLEYMAKTPEERYFEAFLKSKGMTQEQFDALDPEDKEALVQEFEDAVKQRVAEKNAEELARSQFAGLL
ncbi:MAG: hypothetical protein Kow00114_37770 [Kiloniellaceae bacterium]